MTTAKAMNEIKSCLLVLRDDPSVAYLALTSKLEHPVRDKVAWHLHRNHKDLIVAREYCLGAGQNPKCRKRVDLALLDHCSLQPVVLVEFKSMIVPDPLANRDHSLMVSLADDLKRVAALTCAQRFGVMLMVHIENIQRLVHRGLDGRVVKYMDQFRRRADDPKALQRATGISQEFFQRAGLRVSLLTIELKPVWDAKVRLTAFILEPYPSGQNPSIRIRMPSGQKQRGSADKFNALVGSLDGLRPRRFGKTILE